MSKEQLDKMQLNKNTPLDNVLKIIPKFLTVAVVLSAVVIVAKMLFWGMHLKKNIETITTTELIELDTAEKVNYITDVFHIKNTNNIGSYRVSFNEGCMTVMMDDVKDIQELCFENLAYYELTEEDYNEIVITEEEYNESVINLQDEHGQGRHKSPEGEFDGKWFSSWVSPSENYWEMQFRDKNNTYSIFISKRNDVLYCEVRTGWSELEALKKLHSMD